MSVPTPAEILAILGESAESAATAWQPGDPLYVEFWGRFGDGKSHIAGTFPLPIFWHDFDLNLKETFRSYKPERLAQIFHSPRRYLVPTQGEQAASRREAERFQKLYYEDLKKLKRLYEQTGVRGTMVLDPMTQVWDLLRFAYVPYDSEGKVKSAWYYGDVNMRFDALIQQAKAAGVHLVMPVRSKDRWVQADNGTWQKTNIQDADVKDLVHYAATVIVEVTKNPTFDPKSGKTAMNRVYRFRKCTPNGALAGFESDELDYEGLVELIASYEG